ncbi:hypothetical protein [Pseudobacillus badius]|uniref:hypothetical protein n=1 Tax=Bacillus badius TaxID=1455 RepID=UPI0024A53673|nr:hypothetical protein [Bacillus badius]GLY12629.1 hypothetical protein Bbad01_38450 [Bacillus badius]
MKEVILLDKVEEQAFLDKLYNTFEFKTMKAKVEELHQGKTLNLEVIESVKGHSDVIDGNIYNFISVVLLNRERDAKVYVVESTTDQGEQNLVISADVATIDKTEVIGFNINKNEPIEELFRSPYSPGYFEVTQYGAELSATERNEVEAQYWGPSFCLLECKGIYRHCGPGCGDYSSKGGGTPINSIDGCCKIHDTCYHKKQASKGCCDKRLLNCVSTHKSKDYCAFLDISVAFAGAKC